MNPDLEAVKSKVGDNIAALLTVAYDVGRGEVLREIGAACDLVPAESTVANIVAVIERLVEVQRAFTRGVDVGPTYAPDPPHPRLGMVAHYRGGSRVLVVSDDEVWVYAANIARIEDYRTEAVLWELGK